MRLARGVAVGVALVVLAGCASPPPGRPGAAELGPVPPLAGSDCQAWTMVDVQPWNPGDRVGPFERADIRDDIGAPPVGTYGAPTWAGATGNWHQLVRCDDGAGRPFHVAWIGVKVERPAFDAAGPDRQFVASAFFADDPAWVSAIAPRTGDLVSGLHVREARSDAATFAVGYTLDWMGTFEAGGALAPAEADPGAPTRLWLLVPTDGGGHRAWDAPSTYRPLALDLHPGSDGPIPRWVGPGYFRHAAVEDGDDPVPPHTGNGQGLATDHFRIEVTVGPSPLVVLDRAYDHEL